jgi:hypothetical protein
VAVPSFCYLRREQVACGLMVSAGVFGLLLTLSGQLKLVQSWAPWTTWNPGFGWLVGQSTAVLVGGLAAWRGPGPVPRGYWRG